MDRNVRFVFIMLIMAFLVILIFLPFRILLNNRPLNAAKKWAEAVLLGDYQTAISLTCRSSLEDINNLLHPNAASTVQDVNLSNVNFRKSASGGNFAVIDASGTILTKTNNTWQAQEIGQRWQFVYEEDEWKWCGYIVYPGSDTEPVDITVIGIISLVIILLVILYLYQANGPQFFSTKSKGESGNVNQLQPYEIGWVKSFNRFNGSGGVTNEKGDYHLVYYSSIIGTMNRSLTNGEEVLFQKKHTKEGLLAVNVIKTSADSISYNPYSNWLVKLAVRTKRLANDFRIYKLPDVQSNLNTCKAFLEEFNAYIQKHNVKLESYEIVLLADIEKDLSDLSKKVQGVYDRYKSTWWAVILALVLQMVNIVAGIIQVVSPETAMLLRSLGRGLGYLLSQNPSPPLLGPSDE